MKKVLVTMISIAFLLVPAMAYTQSEKLASNAPPISQPLVPEGDFALRLVTALKLGTVNNEAQAEDMLTSVGIAPKNGWIADYPMTPIIIGELQSAVVASADAKKLPIGKDEALKPFQDVAAEFSLAIAPGGSGNYAENQPQVSSIVINDYYYDEGPPVITYYPPPWDYYYLYAWVPYPFWWGGFYFPGFFCLNDFHRVVFVGGHHHLISSHFIDPTTHRVFNVDPTTRTFARSVSTSFSRTEGFNSSDARRGATSIFNRGTERSRSSNMTSTLGKGFTNGNNSNSWSQSSSNPNRSFSGSSSRGSSFSCANCHGESSSFGRSSGGSGSKSFSGGGLSVGFHGDGFGGFHGGGGGFHGGGGGRR
jgi:hypothetical protein